MFPAISHVAFRISGGEALDVRRFRIEERLDAVFTAELFALSADPDLDLEGFVGEPARLDVEAGRSWIGAVRAFELVNAEPLGLSTYRIELVPALWLLSQRRNHRIFQRMTEPEIVTQLLREWNIPHVFQIDPGLYKKRDYRVQYGESDFAFMSRMLEDAGITYWFETAGDQTRVVLADAPHAASPDPAIEFTHTPSPMTPSRFVTALSVARAVRPGKYTVRDVDFRLPPNRPLTASSPVEGKPLEGQLESFDYVPGAFLYEGTGGGTPHADDKIAVRSDEQEAQRLASRRLDAQRTEARTYAFETNAMELHPGMRFPIVGHPRSELGAETPLLVTQTVLEGEVSRAWKMRCRATRTDQPYRPAIATPKPRVSGVETATVVGAKGDEIHTDEFGRVRVHFHWDRASNMDDDSSCWVPVSHPWAGAGYGMINLPRVGQEVIVDFLGGDPDKPIILGRVYTASQVVPYKLPDHKTQSGWKSNSTQHKGGYNEIMLEDAAGRELVRVQAERDMQTLVKHDESRNVQRSRSTQVGANDSTSVGYDKSVSVGHDRKDTVGHDEELSVHHDRTRTVMNDEAVFIGRSFTRQIAKDASDTVGMNASLTVVGNRTVLVGGHQGSTIEGGRSALITGSDAISFSDTYSVTCFPGDEPLGNLTISSGKIELSTGQGASIVLEGDKITLQAKTIEVSAADINATASSKLALSGKKAVDIQAGLGETSVSGKTLKLAGRFSSELTSTGAVTLKGTPVQLNGPGLFAGRVTDLAPAAIMTGAATVVVGGPTFPLQVWKDDKGVIHVGDRIVIMPNSRWPDFQEMVLRDLGMMASTKSGKQLLDNIQNNPGKHKVTIREYTVAEEEKKGRWNAFATPDGGQPSPTFDDGTKITPGAGSDAIVAYNPMAVLGPEWARESPEAQGLHELSHADHMTRGIMRTRNRTDGWDDDEEWQTMTGGVNPPGGGGSRIPGQPWSPTHNDYLKERGYPYQRTNHSGGQAMPDGSPITNPDGSPKPF